MPRGSAWVPRSPSGLNRAGQNPRGAAGISKAVQTPGVLDLRRPCRPVRLHA